MPEPFTVRADSPDPTKVVGIACGSSHSLALISTPDGDMTVSFGRGEDGQLGHGDAEERLRPQAIFALLNKGITSVHCGAEYSMAVASELKEVYSSGWGNFGRLGHGEGMDVFVPKPIAALSGKRIVSASCGDTHTLVATDAGELYSFGRGANGQLGHGVVLDCLVPQKVEALAGKCIVLVACGAEHSLCCTDDGEVYAWGWGRYGNIGDGEREDRNVPTKVLGLEGVKIVQIACGWRHNLAVDDKGVLYCWGWSFYGQCCHGEQCDQLTPKKVEALADKKIVLVAGGWRHTLVADDQGTLFASGWNRFGQCGVQNKEAGGDREENIWSPEIVNALEGKKVQQLAAGWRHSLAVTDDGQFYSWGRGSNGQLGRGTMHDASEPMLVKELSVGGIQLEMLKKESHPVVMYSIPPGDRYAVVPDHGGEGDALPHAVPEMDGPSKKQRVS